MKKDKVYLLTLIGLLATVSVIGFFSTNYLFEVSKERYLEAQLESSKREAREIAKLLEQQLEQGIDKPVVIRHLQKSIENTDLQSGFICMYNTLGEELCHPDPSRVGQVITKRNSEVGFVKTAGTENFLNLLAKGKAAGGVRTFLDDVRDSEVIFIYPVKNTNWMVAAHANIVMLGTQLLHLKVKFILAHVLSGTLIVFFSFILVRWIGSKYEKKIEKEKEQLIEDVKDLTKLNNDLIYERRHLPMSVNANGELQKQDVDVMEDRSSRHRVLTYWRDQLIPIPVENIAFFYTQHSLTYIYCLNGEVYNSNGSLEEINSKLDRTNFFRANRQFIISIRTIDKIYRFGNNQLKINIKPDSPADIIISKNKVSEFKQWLNL